jgi:hypothetical protein
VIPFDLSYTFPESHFTDAEGDDIIVSLVVSAPGAPDTLWINFVHDTVLETITVSGTPPSDNAYAVLYTLNFHVEDPYDDPANVYGVTVLYTDNLSPITGAVADEAFMIPTPKIFDMSAVAGIHSDPEDMVYTVDFTVNGTDWTICCAAFMNWDPVTYILDFFPTLNDHGGLHTIVMTVDDGISASVTESFNCDILFNFPLIAIGYIANAQLIVGNDFLFTFPPAEYFEDPELIPFSTDWRQQGLSFLPYFIDWNGLTGELEGTTTIANIGEYTLEYIGIDNALQETIIEFNIDVVPCYYKCITCWNNDFSSCYTCEDGFYLYGTSCLDFCPLGFWEDGDNNFCEACHPWCTTCDTSGTFAC